MLPLARRAVGDATITFEDSLSFRASSQATARPTSAVVNTVLIRKPQARRTTPPNRRVHRQVRAFREGASDSFKTSSPALR